MHNFNPHLCCFNIHSYIFTFLRFKITLGVSRLMHVISSLSCTISQLCDMNLHSFFQLPLKLFHCIPTKFHQAFVHYGSPVRLPKYLLGFTSLEFVGQKVGDGQFSPRKENIIQIRNPPWPETNEQVRTFWDFLITTDNTYSNIQ